MYIQAYDLDVKALFFSIKKKKILTIAGLTYILEWLFKYLHEKLYIRYILVSVASVYISIWIKLKQT